MLPCTYKQKHNICIFKKNTCISYNVWSIIFWKTCLICCDCLSSAGSGAHSGEHPVLSGCPLSVRGWAGVSRVAPGHLRGHAVEEAHWEDGAHWSTVERPVWKTSVVSWRMWIVHGLHFLCCPQSLCCTKMLCCRFYSYLKSWAPQLGYNQSWNFSCLQTYTVSSRDVSILVRTNTYIKISILLGVKQSRT